MIYLLFMDVLTRIEEKYPVRQRKVGMPHRKLGVSPDKEKGRLTDLTAPRLPEGTCCESTNARSHDAREHTICTGAVGMAVEQRFEHSAKAAWNDDWRDSSRADIDRQRQAVAKPIEVADKRAPSSPGQFLPDAMDHDANPRFRAVWLIAAPHRLYERIVAEAGRRAGQRLDKRTFKTCKADMAVAVQQFSGVEVEDGGHPTISPTAHSGCAASHSDGVQMPNQSSGGRSLDAPATLDDPDGGSLVRNGESL
jgi:hypothetical protein